MNITYKDIAIVHEDNHILVAVKPQGLPVCEDGTGDIDMLSLLKEYRKQNESKSGEAYLGLVHRLDRPAGGVIVFAKTSKAAARLADAIKNHEIEKRYFAVLDGTPRESTGELTNYLLKDTKENKVRVVPLATEGAKKAVLRYKVLAEKNGQTLVDVDLETGRAHQIRVQFSTIFCPLVGDHKYGNGSGKTDLCLWAYQLRFTHPVTGKTMMFRVYPPEKTGFSQFEINRFLSINIKD